MAVRSGLLLTALIVCLAGAAPARAAACSAMRWTTLGTAGGPVPTADRAEPSNLLVAGDQQILVDTGDGTVNQLAGLGMDMRRIRTVFISHLHLDHSGGLAAVIGLRWMNQFPGQLTIYGPPGIREVVDGIIASMAPPASARRLPALAHPFGQSNCGVARSCRLVTASPRRQRRTATSIMMGSPTPQTSRSATASRWAIAASPIQATRAPAMPSLAWRQARTCWSAKSSISTGLT